MDIWKIALAVGILILVVIFTIKAINKQKKELAELTPPARVTHNKQQEEKANQRVARQWKATGILLDLAAIGNMYSAFVSTSSALKNGSWILWIDAGLSVIAAVVVMVLKLKRDLNLVYLYVGIILLPSLFFLATGQYIPAVIHLFPLVLVYLVINPVRKDMK